MKERRLSMVRMGTYFYLTSNIDNILCPSILKYKLKKVSYAGDLSGVPYYTCEVRSYPDDAFVDVISLSSDTVVYLK